MRGRYLLQAGIEANLRSFEGFLVEPKGEVEGSPREKLAFRFAFCLPYVRTSTTPAALLNDNFLYALLIQGELFSVGAIKADRIQVDRVWHKRDAKRVLLYKMVLNPRQKFLLR